jgi:hypothetical protein
MSKKMLENRYDYDRSLKAARIPFTHVSLMSGILGFPIVPIEIEQLTLIFFLTNPVVY